MNVLLIDNFREYFVDLSLRLEAQGHSVRVFHSKEDNGELTQIGKGLIDRTGDWQSSMRWADLVLVSGNGPGVIRSLEPYRRAGYPIFSQNAAVIEWEIDRDKGQEVLESVGIECLRSIRFKNYDEAIAYQREHMDVRYVCKPCKDVDKALSYVSKSAKDMIFMLEHWKKQFKKPVPFIFQEFCPGIEVAVGGWMGRNGFLGYVLENFEHKKLMNGEKGPNTGEMGTVMKYVPMEESKLAIELLAPIEAELIRQGYTGFIDVAVMVGTEGPRKGKLNPLEFTSRFGWPLFNIQQILHPDVEWMRDALEGCDTFRPSQEIALGIQVAIPDFPNEKLKEPELSGFPVWGIDADNRFYVHPQRMKLGEGIDDKGKKVPMMVTAGNEVCVVSGMGATVSEAKAEAYEHLSQLEIPNSPMYRTDIGDRLKDALRVLKKFGYCSSWRFE